MYRFPELFSKFWSHLVFNNCSERRESLIHSLHELRELSCEFSDTFIESIDLPFRGVSFFLRTFA